MIRLTAVLAAVALAASTGSFAARAGDPAGDKGKKEVKLTGSIVCGKCKLKIEGLKKCVNALEVKEEKKDKPTIYLLDDKGMDEDYSQCGGGELENVTVVGTLTEKDGQKWVKPTKVDYKKK